MTNGLATDASIVLSNVAPATAPIMPGMTSRRNSFQSTLRCTTWLTPDAAVVKVSTAWTLAEATAGGTPITVTNRVELITPNAMPSAPSMTCAAKPIAMNGSTWDQSIAVRKSGIAGGNSRRPAKTHWSHRARYGQFPQQSWALPPPSRGVSTDGSAAQPWKLRRRSVTCSG